MKITEVQTILLTGPCTLDPYLAEARKIRSAAFIRIYTDSGLIGLGETYAGYFIPEVVPQIVDFFKPILLGRNVDDIPQLWDRMYHCGNFWCRVGLGVAVLAGIEAALWDLKGKMLKLPVYKILRDVWEKDFYQLNINKEIGTKKASKLPCYATGGPSNYPLDKLIKKIEYYHSLGFKGVKVGAGAYWKDRGYKVSTDPSVAADFEAKKADSIRENFGNDLWLMFDAHMGNSPSDTWDIATALAVAKALEPYNLFFLEEPLHYTQPHNYADLCRNTTTVIAGGECLASLSEWKPFIDQDSFDIGQLDASFTGGLNQFMEVALILAGKGHFITTHAWGAGGSLMQNIHCGFACPTTKILEIAPKYGPLHSEIIGDSFDLKNGNVLPPEEPGLGIRLTEDTIQKFPFKPGSGEFNNVPGKRLVN